MRHLLIPLIVVALAVPLAPAAAGVPGIVSYQGLLRDGVGDPVPDGAYELTFRLYDVETGGTTLWTETQTVAVDQGVFSATLGEIVSLASLAFDGPYWLGISVGTDAELTPRVELTTSPYAFRAAVAESLVGGAVADADWQYSGDDIYRLTGRVAIGTDSAFGNLTVTADGDQHAATISSNGEGPWFTVSVVNPSGTAGAFSSSSPPSGYPASPAAVFAAAGSTADAGHFTAHGDGSGVLAYSLGTGAAVEGHADGTGYAGYFDGGSGVRMDCLAWADGFRMDTGASPGHVLTSDGSGIGTWQAPAAVPDDDWIIDGGNVYRPGGFVGIGTSTPGRDIHIKRDGATGVGISIENMDPDVGSTETIGFLCEDGPATITAYDDDYTLFPNGFSISNNRPGGGMRLRTGGMTRIEIEHDGFVGIGESDPGERLDVAGTVRMDGFQLTASPTAGHVLTSDGSGYGSWEPPGELTLPYAGSASETGAAFRVTNQDDGPAVEGLNSDPLGNTRGCLSDASCGVFGEHLNSGNFGYLGGHYIAIYGKSYVDQAVHGRHEPSGHYGLLGSATHGGFFNGDVAIQNGAFGIGIDTPTVALDVVGDALVTSGSTGRALDVQKTYASGVSQTANIERTEVVPANNDMLQIKVPAGSDDNFQFIECERGAGFEFVVDGDGHVLADGGAEINGACDVNALLDVDNYGDRVGDFASGYPSGGTHVVHSEYTGSGDIDAIAVYGKCEPANNYGYGAYFEGGYQGVHTSVQSTGAGYYYGVNAVTTGGTGSNYGVRGYVTGSGNNYGIYGHASGGTSYAGYFSGNAEVTGTLSKGGGSFKIDHPLDPANKYLQHSFVESPDMMNVYNGNVVLDAAGEAWIELPEWFEVLNRDFRYQLTAIGAPGPNLYVAQEISGNRFMIAGGEPGTKVSWQVTGIRQDPFAEAHRIPVESVKPPNEAGKYVHPELYGLPESAAVHYVEERTIDPSASIGPDERTRVRTSSDQ